VAAQGAAAGGRGGDGCDRDTRRGHGD